MTRHYPAQWLDEITAVSGQWLRRCEGEPKAGMPVNRHGLRVVLGQSDSIVVEPDQTITWHFGGRKFTAEPVRS